MHKHLGIKTYSQPSRNEGVSDQYRILGSNLGINHQLLKQGNIMTAIVQDLCDGYPEPVQCDSLGEALDYVGSNSMVQAQVIDLDTGKVYFYDEHQMLKTEGEVRVESDEFEDED